MLATSGRDRRRIVTHPTLTNAVRADEIAGAGEVTTASVLHRQPVTARLVRDDGVLYWAPGWMLGWTREHVLVRATMHGLVYEVWLRAEDVTQRA
jgi:hypothetical protein